MADVRSLLRQQQAARRITHPHASYAESGKLTCSLCGEAVRTETLWANHIRGAAHRWRLQALRETQKQRGEEKDGGGDEEEEDAVVVERPTGKRKHVMDDEDEDMEETVRRKRSKAEIASPAPLHMSLLDREGERDIKEQTLTPPPLTRRTSTTPVHGVEIKIPSRPATPMAPRDGSTSSSTPNTAPLTRTGSLPGGMLSSTSTAFPVGGSTTGGSVATAGQVDDDEWAAFEADIAAATAPYSQDAVISAPAMTAEEVAAKTEAEEAERRTAAADIEMEDEKEEATRALEAEFDEMEQLEERARRLRERREALRVQKTGGVDSASAKPNGNMGKENVDSAVGGGGEEGEDEDEDEDYEEDDDYAWGGFRLRGGAA